MKKRSFKIIKNIIEIMIFFVSFVFFIITIKTDKNIYSILSIPFIILLICIFHEFGHVLACLLTKTKILSIKVLFFKIDKKVFKLLDVFYFGGSVSFSSHSRWKKLIYLMGPVFSLIILLVSLMIYYITHRKLLIIMSIIALVSFIIVTLPFKGTDIYNIIKKGEINYEK